MCRFFSGIIYLGRPDGRVENAFKIAPDWTIEILSPNQRQSKVIRNILHCLDHGTEMGWLVDPEEFCIFVYSADKSVQVFEGEMVLPVPEFAQGLQLKVSEIFAWLKSNFSVSQNISTSSYLP